MRVVNFGVLVWVLVWGSLLCFGSVCACEWNISIGSILLFMFSLRSFWSVDSAVKCWVCFLPNCFLVFSRIDCLIWTIVIRWTLQSFFLSVSFPLVVFAHIMSSLNWQYPALGACLVYDSNCWAKHQSSTIAVTPASICLFLLNSGAGYPAYFPMLYFW